ncbi:MAG TPA: hypothetical protein PLI19_01880 [Erysipelotrichaceae bacterium]|jgi:hypothetical protein|nr:hypothetical protein [Erysipelotrichaceae bacterium]
MTRPEFSLIEKEVTKEELILMEKQMKLMELLPNLSMFPMLSKYFDADSNEMLDEKIEVLEALQEGKQPIDIPNFESIFELLPKEGKWD